MKRPIEEEKITELPTHILAHPYFHDGISEGEARELAMKSSETKGNFLFCRGTEKGKIACVYKYINNSAYKIWTTVFDYLEDVQAFKDNHDKTSELHTLLEIIHSASEDVKLRAHIFRESNVFIPKPILNDATIKKMQLQLNHESVLPPLPNDIVNLIFDKLDKKSLLQAALVSKSWHALFGKNVHSIVTMTDAVESERVQKLNAIIKEKEELARAEHMRGIGGRRRILE